MGYKRAIDMLPSELILQIQQYVDGESIYIPRAIGKERKWGESTDIRFALDSRNEEIYDKYNNGVSVRRLAEEYHISTQGIYKILSKLKT